MYLLFSLSLICLTSSSQNNADTLNKYNDKGKKHGYWKVYLTETIVKTKDSTKAFYYAYNYYENGSLVILTTNLGTRKKPVKIEYDGVKSTAGHPVLLNGRLKLYDKHGLEYDEIYANGLPTYKMSYASYKGAPNVKLELLDYSRPYKNQMGSFYYELYYQDGTVYKKYWFTKNEKGKWDLIPVH